MWELGLGKTVGAKESDCGAVGVLPAPAFKLIYGNLVTARRAMSGRLKSRCGYNLSFPRLPVCVSKREGARTGGLGTALSVKLVFGGLRS